MKKTENFYTEFDWKKILSMNPPRKFNINDYHRILSPEFPEFLRKYTELPVLKRLSGIGLLCGTDWTPLYRNRFFYSRLDHSIGVALIIWHFTNDMIQTLSGLLHDVSTPVFSHVTDFRKGDALRQEVTETKNSSIIMRNRELAEMLEQDGILPEQVADYHKFPLADNEIPRLSADRLEYMFPSGAALYGEWTADEIRSVYDDIRIMQNEDGLPELGFASREKAFAYCKKFCMTGHILQLNENKLALQLLGEIMNLAVKEKILSEDDFMKCSEAHIISALDGKGTAELRSLFRTFRTMGKILHTEKPLPGHFCVNLNVKQRFINPLVTEKGGTHRISEIMPEAAALLHDFRTFSDTKFGCVPLAEP